VAARETSASKQESIVSSVAGTTSFNRIGIKATERFAVGSDSVTVMSCCLPIGTFYTAALGNKERLLQ
jgi:hypothetical protein